MRKGNGSGSADERLVAGKRGEAAQGSSSAFKSAESHCTGPSLRLAAHLLARPESIQGDLRILELGSGSGLLGILIAKEAPQSQVHLTDLDGVVLERLHDAVEESECSVARQRRVWRWA